MSFAIDVCIKTVMFLVTASLLSWIARRASASLRHALWASALLAVLAFPLVVLVAPAIDLAVLPAGFAASSVRPVSVPPFTTTMETIAIVQPAVAPPAPAPAPKGDWTSRFALLWIAGCLIVLLQSILAFRELRRFKVRSQRPDDSWVALFTGMRRELSLSRRVELRMSMNPGPLTCGIIRKMILLPADAGTWALARRRLVLAHEIAHVKRSDGLGQLLCQLACAVYWFNPLVWYAVRQLRVERERACDDFVLGLGESAPDYADSLLQIARGLNAGIRLTAVSMACPSQLKSRVIAILDSKIRRKRMSKLATAALVFGTAALTIGVGAVRMTALEAMPLPIRLMPAPPEEPTQPREPAPAQEATPGYVVNRSPFSYPVEAIQKRIEGSVVVELTFNDLGEITGSRILSGPDELRQAALQTALQGKYSISTARSLQVVVDFKLPAAGTGEVSGTSADPSGIAVPGVEIKATNRETGTVTSVVANQTGAYRFQNLPAGTYRMSAQLAGFRTNTFDNVKLDSQQQVRLNFALWDDSPFSTEIVLALPPQTELSVRPAGFNTVVESVDIRGLQEPLLTEMRQKFESLPGQRITTDLLDQVRSTILASSWGQKPYGFMMNPRTANGSDLLIVFYQSSPSTARVHVLGNVAAANLVNQVKPVYPQEAKDKSIQGPVILEIDIGTDGSVTGTRVVSGHPLLVQPAIDAVRQWVYKPVFLDDQPVVAVTTVALNFAFQQ